MGSCEPEDERFEQLLRNVRREASDAEVLSANGHTPEQQLRPLRSQCI